MEEMLTLIGQGILDCIIYLINGFLLALYFIIGQLPLLLSLACAALVALYFDPQAQRRTQFMPGRGLRPAARAPETMRHHQLLTVVTAALWIVASSLFPSPVPWLGLAMWALTVAGLALLPAERVSLLWRCKTFILIYSFVLFAFRGYLALLGRVTPEAWAAVVGSSAEAQRVLAQNRGLFTTIGFWVSCFALPGAQAAYLVQRLTVHPMSLLGPRMWPAEILDAIRTRGKD